MTTAQQGRLFANMDKIADPIIKFYKKWDMDIDKGQIAQHNPVSFIWAIRTTGSEYMSLDFDPYIYTDETKAETWELENIRHYALNRHDRMFGVLNNTHFYIIINGKIDQITKKQAMAKVDNFIDALMITAKNIMKEIKKC